MLSPLLVHLYIPLWKSTAALSAMPHLDRLWINFLKIFVNQLLMMSLCPSLSSHLSLTSLSSSSSSSSSSSPSFSLCNTPSHFYSKLKTYLFHKSFPTFPPYLLRVFSEISGILMTISGPKGGVEWFFTLLIGFCFFFRFSLFMYVS